MTNYHIIGDIHGYADKLEALLQHLGYTKIDGVYQQDSAKVVFLGDFIDRGPHQRRVIDIVRPMIDSGAALAIMGNHEFNAICYHTQHPETGLPLREHGGNNYQQHEMFLDDYGLNEDETRDVIKWFKSLPLYLEVKGHDDGPVLFRAVHACWNQDVINRVPHCVDDAYILAASEKGSQPYKDIEILLKGLEITLPDGASILINGDKARQEIRVKWWSSLKECTYRDVAVVPKEQKENVPNIPLPDLVDSYIYPDDAPPVFFGHYWMTGQPQIIGHNLACLDYSAGKGGSLIAYHWNNVNTTENKLGNQNFSFVQ